MSFHMPSWARRMRAHKETKEEQLFTVATETFSLQEILVSNVSHKGKGLCFTKSPTDGTAHQWNEQTWPLLSYRIMVKYSFGLLCSTGPSGHVQENRRLGYCNFLVLIKCRNMCLSIINDSTILWWIGSCKLCTLRNQQLPCLSSVVHGMQQNKLSKAKTQKVRHGPRSQWRPVTVAVWCRPTVRNAMLIAVAAYSMFGELTKHSIDVN